MLVCGRDPDRSCPLVHPSVRPSRLPFVVGPCSVRAFVAAGLLHAMDAQQQLPRHAQAQPPQTPHEGEQGAATVAQQQHLPGASSSNTGSASHG